MKKLKLFIMSILMSVGVLSLSSCGLDNTTSPMICSSEKLALDTYRVEEAFQDSILFGIDLNATQECVVSETTMPKVYNYSFCSYQIDASATSDNASEEVCVEYTVTFEYRAEIDGRITFGPSDNKDYGKMYISLPEKDEDPIDGKIFVTGSYECAAITKEIKIRLMPKKD